MYQQYGKRIVSIIALTGMLFSLAGCSKKEPVEITTAYDGSPSGNGHGSCPVFKNVGG